MFALVRFVFLFLLLVVAGVFFFRRMRKKSSSKSVLWDLIVKYDDICFTHILPRLNRTDLKFLYEVNTETRKLVKRSTRKKELKRKFKIEEMSSISTLEVAWEHKSLWPRHWDETYFCWKLLKRINSSCSSGRERRKSVSGMRGRLIWPQNKVIWKW